MNNPENQGYQTKKQQDASGSELKRIKVSIDALTDEIKAQRREQAEREQQNKWPKRTAKAAIVYTGLTFIIMLIYGWQNYLIRSNNVVSQRAFVSFGFRPGFPIWGGMPKQFTTQAIGAALSSGSTPNALEFIVDITNGGNTGTKNLTFFLKCATSPEDLKDPWPLLYQGKNDAVKTPQFIGPHATGQAACAFTSADQIDAMISGKFFGYIMVDALYQDRLANDWHRTESTAKVTNFQKIPMTEPNGTIGIGITASVITYGAHNCADEECPAD